MGATSLPRVNAQLLAAQGMVSAEPYRVLLVGQIGVDTVKGSDGNATSGQVYENIESRTNSDLIALFGNSGEFINRIYKIRALAQGRFSIYAIGLTASASSPVEATRALVYGGTSTEARTMTVRLISQKDFSVNVVIPSGTTAAAVAGLVNTAIGNLPNRFPADPTVATATLTLEATDAGTIPNKWTVEHINIPAGITVNTNSVTDRAQFSGGSADPSFTGIFDNVSSTRFHAISWPWHASFSEVQTFLEARNAINNEFLHGVAFMGVDGTQAALTQIVNATANPLNSQNLIFAGNRQVSGASVIIEPPDWRLAEFIGIEGLRLTDGVPIGQYITTSSPLDAVGGSGSASLAYYNTPLANTSPSNLDDLFDGTEQLQLTNAGFTIIGTNTAGNATLMGEVVTTYKTNTLGNPDVSFKFLNYVRTSYLALEIFFRTLKSDYSQSRLTEGDVIPGRAMANSESITAEYTRIYKLLSGPGFVLTQAGPDAEAFFFRNLNLTINVAAGRVTSSGQLPIVTQIREFITTFQIAFSIGG